MFNTHELMCIERQLILMNYISCVEKLHELGAIDDNACTGYLTTILKTIDARLKVLKEWGAT